MRKYIENKQTTGKTQKALFIQEKAYKSTAIEKIRGLCIMRQDSLNQILFNQYIILKIHLKHYEDMRTINEI